MDMGNLVHSISADKKSKEKAHLWLNEYIKKEQNWKGDARKMNEILAKEGFENSSIEVYSPQNKELWGRESSGKSRKER